MSNYRRGVEIERKIIASLVEKGWLASRTAGSHGLFDIIAINETSVKLIQAKRIKEGKKYYADKNVKLFKELKVPDNVSKELWVWFDRKGFEVTNLCQENKPTV